MTMWLGYFIGTCWENVSVLVKWQVQTLVELHCVKGSGDYETGISNPCRRRENLDGAISKNVRLRAKEDEKFLMFTF